MFDLDKYIVHIGFEKSRLLTLEIPTYQGALDLINLMEKYYTDIPWFITDKKGNMILSGRLW